MPSNVTFFNFILTNFSPFVEWEFASGEWWMMNDKITAANFALIQEYKWCFLALQTRPFIYLLGMKSWMFYYTLLPFILINGVLWIVLHPDVSMSICPLLWLLFALFGRTSYVLNSTLSCLTCWTPPLFLKM